MRIRSKLKKLLISRGRGRSIAVIPESNPSLGQSVFTKEVMKRLPKPFAIYEPAKLQDISFGYRPFYNPWFALACACISEGYTDFLTNERD